ncbi:MAG: hypothetical protein M3O02_00465 [Acidobacteriota bacterium]|nr:hypothetical protein [Acidobacteriota bacterium]
MRLSALFVLCLAGAPLVGCHSAYIEATVVNRTAQPIPLVEIDYPSASFGTQNLAPGAEFHYRFKVLGSGGTTVLWTDAAHRDGKAPGPTLREGDEGRLRVAFMPGGPVWDEALTSR